MIRRVIKYFLPIILHMLGYAPSLTAQYLTGSVNYEDHSKFAEDLSWINIKVNPITKDTIVNAKTTQDFYIINKKGIKIVEGRIEGYDGHECGCQAEKNGLWIERFENGGLKSIESFSCGYKKGQSIYYYENGNRHKVENYAAAPFPQDTNFILMTRETFLVDAFWEYYESGEIKTIGEYKIDQKGIENNGVIVGYDLFSSKTGTWRTYDKSGKIIAIEEFGY